MKKTNWQIKKLGEIFLIERGGSPRPIESFLTKEENGINWIKIGDTKDITKYIYKTAEKIKPEGLKKSRLVQEDDFILSNSMSFGRPYIMKTSGAIHDGWLVLRKKLPDIDKDYFYYLLSSSLVFQQFDRLASGSTVRNLNVQLVSSVLVPFPPLPEQKRIVKILDEVFEEVGKAKGNAEKNLRNSRELFEAYLQSVFENKGEGWEPKMLEDVCDIQSKLIDPRKTEFLDLTHIGAGNIEIKTGNLVNLKTSKEEKLISGKFRFDNSMVLYSKIRPYLMKVARPDFQGLCSADIYPLFPRKKLMTRDYLFYLLLTPRFTEYAIKGSARAGMPKVNRDHLFAFNLFLPSLSEQKAIVKKLDALSEETKKLEEVYKKEIADLKELKKSVLQKAFRGEL